jgi:hypothetical protein
VTWLGVPCLLTCPPAPSTPGEARGGGWWTEGGVRRHLAVSAATTDGTSPAGQLRYDGKDGVVVRSADVTSLVVDGASATVRGTATVNGQDGYRYELTVTDGGASDSARLVVTKPLDPLYRLESAGPLGGGNLVVRSS